MKFLADMGISPKSVHRLREMGFDAYHLHERKLSKLPDSKIYALAKVEGRIVLTHDLDFSDIVPPRSQAHAWRAKKHFTFQAMLNSDAPRHITRTVVSEQLPIFCQYARYQMNGFTCNKPEWLSPASKGVSLEVNTRGRPQDGPFEMLEPYDVSRCTSGVKVSRTVLRRRAGREPRDLSGCTVNTKPSISSRENTIFELTLTKERRLLYGD